MGFFEFMKLRFVRLYPLYILGTLTMSALIVIETVPNRSFEPLTFIVTNVTAASFLPTPRRASINSSWLYPLNYPAWSLFFELFANAVFASLAVFLRSWRVLLAVVLIGLAISVRYVIQAGDLGEIGPNFHHWVGGFGRVTLSFFLGVLVHRLWSAQWMPRIAWPVSISSALVLIAFAVPSEGPGRAVLDLAVCTLLFPLVVLAGARAKPQRALARFCALSGQLSYGVYILQIPIIYAAASLTEYAVGSPLIAFGPMATIAIVCVLFAVSAAADKYYDRPLRAWIGRNRARRLH